MENSENSDPNPIISDQMTSVSGDLSSPLEHQNLEFKSDPFLGKKVLYASSDVSDRSSCASTDNDDLEGVRKVLQKRRLSRQAAVTNHINPTETHSLMKILKLAIQEHELPVRMAYKQIDELAANAERVKASIEKNRSLLLIQVRKHNFRYLRAALMGWRLYIDKKIEKKMMLYRARMLLTQGLLSRAFKAWCLDLLRNRKYKRLQTSVEKVLRRHLLRRLWILWIEFVRKRKQKTLDRRKQKQILKDANDKLKERLGRRAEVFMHHKRLERIFFAFLEGCHIVKTRRLSLIVLYQKMLKRRLCHIFEMWKLVTKVKLFHMRVVKRITNKRLGACFRAWRYKNFQLDIYLRKIARCRLSQVFVSWFRQVRRDKEMKSRIQRKRLLWSFNAFRHVCYDQKWWQCFQNRVIRKMNHHKLKMAFRAWLLFMQLQREKKFVKLEEYVAVIEKENERSKLECRRLSQVVESGEWGKQQLADILQAKDVLAGEREALMSLIDHLQQQQTAALEQKQKNNDEMQHFKDQMFGNNFIHHNKMLIKGASSFNTVVRALKLDASKRGIDQEYLYGTDRLAMDKVSIFPDGEIRVKTLNTFDKGKWMPKHPNASCMNVVATSHTPDS